MHRRAFLRGIAGSAALGGVALGAVEGVAAHPGPYRPFGSVAVENAREAVVDDDGDTVYVAADDGFAVVDVANPWSPRIVAEKRDLLADRETGPLVEIQDLKVEGDRLVVAGPANPKPAEILKGFLLYDVSDPANPEQVAFHETDYPIHNCEFADGRVYLTESDGEGNGLTVVDVSDDDPTVVARWSLADRDERWLEVPTLVWDLHDVWVRGDRAYLAHWDAGAVVLDVSDPADPAFVSRFAGQSLDDLASIPDDGSAAHLLALPGNVHYAMTDEAGDLLALNHEAWSVDGEGGPGGVELWDVSDEADPTRLSTIDAPPTPDASQQGTWTTAHNLDVVDGRLFTSWYQGGVKIHDITDPANPEEMAWWRDPGETAFWTAKRATQRFFVATSIGDYLGGVEGEAGLYTFPIEEARGEDAQKDPPPLTTTGTAGRTGENQSGDAGATGSAEANASDPTPTTTEEAALANETTATDSESASSSVPGFGVPTAVAALLGAGAWKRYRD